MDLILVRHGIAEDLGGTVRCDADRRLTPEGRERTRQAAAGLRSVGCVPSVILTSPFARARETADILGVVLPCSGGVEDLPALAAGADPLEAIQAVAGRPEEVVLIVGHLPDLSEIAGVLLAGRPDVGIEFKKAAACYLACVPRPSPASAWLRWSLPPRILRQLGGERERSRKGP